MPPAFEKCGLFPINEEKVLERLPSVTATESIATNVDKALLAIGAGRGNLVKS